MIFYEHLFFCDIKIKCSKIFFYMCFYNTIHYGEDGIVSGGWGQFLDEVRGNGIPGELWDWELLEQSIGPMSL